MEITYTILYAPVVIEEHIPDLDKQIKDEVQRAIYQKLTTHPYEFGKPLRYSLKGQRSLRVGDYRILYRITDATKTIMITGIKHRRYELMTRPKPPPPQATKMRSYPIRGSWFRLW